MKKILNFLQISKKLFIIFLIIGVTLATIININTFLDDMNYFNDPDVNCSYMSEGGKLFYLPKNLCHLNEFNNKIGIFNLNIIYTPGHTSDCISIIDDESKVMFAGDFIFSKMIGRTDLKTGNMLMMFKSIDKIFPYIKNNNYIIYSGHDEKGFTSKELLSDNVYFKRKNR